ncbi:MAG: hypothetical protein HETSPECPRED_006787 [Heterodermia speciosa]|uniref:Ribonuclease P/MRP protein subunit POP5 n=1 Tax=Heterodermia speciosa TaxID=116794 RepID=A0A8H3FLM5_9LECA|nr:MAG: hypothetical protein HETSPECPRED_006787 [Heterodermia speciosa]
MVRVKHRYLLLNILYPEPEQYPWKASLPDTIQFHHPSPDDLTPQLLARAIKDQISILYGDYGAGLTNNGLNIKYLSPATSTAIIRCSRDNYRLVWAALTYMTQLPKSSRFAQARSCVMQVVRVSGTIKKSEEEAIRRAKNAILKAKKDAAGSATEGLNAILDQFGPDVDLEVLRQKRSKPIATLEDEDDDDLEMMSGSD